MNSFKKKAKKSKKRHDKKRKKDRKRRRRSSSSSSSSDSSSTTSTSSSSSSSDEKHKKRHKKDRKRKRAAAAVKTDVKLKTGESSKTAAVVAPVVQLPVEKEDDFSIPLKLMDSKQKAPETKEAYEKRQSVIRKVVDEETGRTRLIRGAYLSMRKVPFNKSFSFLIAAGDGEIIEEMVSKDRHREINKQATRSDGQHYNKKMMGWAANSNNSN
jgi:hypothetical protein